MSDGVLDLKTYVILSFANLCFRARAFVDYFIGFIETYKTTKNWWDALAVYFGILNKVYIRFRDTSISFYLSKENW